jgi:hypothetical protein
MLLAIVDATKSAQNLLNIAKSGQRQLVQETLKFHQKLRFWFFSKKNFHV